MNSAPAASSRLRHLFSMLILSSCALALSACGTQNVSAPTPLAILNLSGTWVFTFSANTSGVTGFTGTLANVPANGDEQSTSVSGSLQVLGTCISNQNDPITLTGTATNPHDIYITFTLTGSGDPGTLTLNAGQSVNAQTLSGSYSITSGPCATATTSFTAQRTNSSS